jgi:hypothetical protein
MKLPRVGITELMAIVAIAGLNFWAYQACYYYGWTNEGANANKREVLYIGSIPMANILAVGMLIGIRRRGCRSFLVGFEVFGAVALAVYITLNSLYCHELVRPYNFRIQNHVFATVRASHIPVFIHVPIFLFSAGVILGGPQLAFALLGGLLSKKLRIADRRDRTQT